jgi:putative N6-adenine-specific DNA methylase
LEKTTPLEKRIKRHITGRAHSFFVAATPGLEALCLEELKSIPLSTATLSMVRGGIEFEGRLQDCYLANLHLRIANRVLMRIAGFKASNFSSLEKKLASVPWELYLSRGTMFEINTSTKHSRLYHKDAIDERISTSIANREGLIEFHQGSAPHITASQQIFVRVVDDRFTISLDSSGELLHKRGLKEHNARAPIRETIAAAALRMAGYNGNEPLLDPMSGSGTFSIEAAMLATKTPPGLYRDFAFMDWPCFGPERWMHLKKESEKEIIDLKPFLIIASEKDHRLYAALKERTVNFNPSRSITVINMDFFDMKSKDLPVMFNTRQTGLVIINPPYGIRLGTKSKSREIFRNIIKKLGSDFKGWRYALFVLDQNLIREVPFERTSILLDHGGLKLVLLTGTV